MNKEPFIITLGAEDLPNIADNSGTEFKYDKNNIWSKDNTNNTVILDEINKKLDIIIDLLKDK